MKCPFFATCHYSTMVSCCIVSWIQPDNCGCQPRENLWNNSHSKSLEKFKTTLILMQPTLTCQIIMQQVLLFFGEKNTYTALLGPTRLLILRWYSTYTIIKFWKNFLCARFFCDSYPLFSTFCKQLFKVYSGN